MNLYTEVKIPAFPFKISHQQRGLVVGSCFAQVIGDRLVNVTNNPYGVLFNPASIAQSLEFIDAEHNFTRQELIENGGLWHSPFHHGSFSDTSPQKVLEKINRPIEKHYQYMVLTLGTAYVYKYQGQVVANCHKMPQNCFERQMLDYQQVVDILKTIAEKHPDTNILLTVSPVRHKNDGLPQNSLSKAILRAAVGKICDTHDNCHYFPAYEIMMDELRDYRFYKEDMVHPSPQAEQYIWQKFSDALLDKPTQELLERMQKINAALSHRPLHPQGAEYEIFTSRLRQQIEDIKADYPLVEFPKNFHNFAG